MTSSELTKDLPVSLNQPGIDNAAFVADFQSFEPPSANKMTALPSFAQPAVPPIAPPRANLQPVNIVAASTAIEIEKPPIPNRNLSFKPSGVPLEPVVTTREASIGGGNQQSVSLQQDGESKPPERNSSFRQSAIDTAIGGVSPAATPVLGGQRAGGVIPTIQLPGEYRLGGERRNSDARNSSFRQSAIDAAIAVDDEGPQEVCKYVCDCWPIDLSNIASVLNISLLSFSSTYSEYNVHVIMMISVINN